MEPTFFLTLDSREKGNPRFKSTIALSYPVYFLPNIISDIVNLLHIVIIHKHKVISQISKNKKITDHIISYSYC